MVYFTFWVLQPWRKYKQMSSSINLAVSYDVAVTPSWTRVMILEIGLRA
jgi:hypothetical protein